MPSSNCNYQHQNRRQAIDQNAATRSALEAVSGTLRQNGLNKVPDQLGDLPKAVLTSTIVIGGFPIPHRDGRSQLAAPSAVSVPLLILGCPRTSLPTAPLVLVGTLHEGALGNNRALSRPRRKLSLQRTTRSSLIGPYQNFLQTLCPSRNHRHYRR